MAKRLSCPCCGAVHYGEQDWNQDTGFTHCHICADSIAADNERDWDALAAKVADAMNPTNRAKFLAMDTPLQRGIMLSMMDDGIITWGSVVTKGA